MPHRCKHRLAATPELDTRKGVKPVVKSGHGSAMEIQRSAFLICTAAVGAMSRSPIGPVWVSNAATLAALKTGAHGILLSRKYSEMRLSNLTAAGRAVRDAMKS